ncbi:uncharacterized protein METZ01_LOCUS73747, partial [marine metagenome]
MLSQPFKLGCNTTVVNGTTDLCHDATDDRWVDPCINQHLFSGHLPKP